MGFSLYMHAFESGEETSGNRAATLKFLGSYDWTASDDSVTVVAATGEELRFYGTALMNESQSFDGSNYRVRAFSEAEIEVVWGFAAAAGFAIINPQFRPPKPMWLLPPGVNEKDLPDTDPVDYPVARIPTAEALRQILTEDFERFLVFRDKVVGRVKN